MAMSFRESFARVNSKDPTVTALTPPTVTVTEGYTTMRDLTVHKSALVGAAAAFTLVLSACGGGSDDPATTGADGTEAAGDASGQSLTVACGAMEDLCQAWTQAFTEETGYEVEIVAPGDAGALVNQLILTKDAPLGDAVYGIDSSFASRAVSEGVLAAYVSPQAPEGFDDGEGHLTAIDQGDVCLNVDLGWFEENGLEVPDSFDDLIDPAYKDLTVVTNPASSSPGLSFMLATIAEYGEDGWQGYWTDLLANGAKVAAGWSDAYYVDFSGSEGEGPFPIVLSYSSSPAAEIGDDGQPGTASVAATCYRQVEYAGVLEGAENPEAAQALVDFLLTDTVQNDIPGSMYMYPVSATATLPAEWEAAAPLAEEPLQLESADVDANRARWLEEWLEVVG